MCAALWKKCERTLESVKLASLPSRRRFNARLGSCNATMAACVGPAEGGFRSQLAQAASEGAVEYGSWSNAASGALPWPQALASACA